MPVNVTRDNARRSEGMGRWTTVIATGAYDLSFTACSVCHMSAGGGSFRYTCAHIPATTVNVNSAYIPVVYVDSVGDKCACGCNCIVLHPVDGVRRTSEYDETEAWQAVMRTSRRNIVDSIREALNGAPHCDTCLAPSDDLADISRRGGYDPMRACPGCVRRFHAGCDDCSRLWAEQDVYTLMMDDGGERRVCTACVGNYSSCSHCSRYHRNDPYGLGAECCETDEDGYVAGCTCYDCEDNTGRAIHNYSFRPTLRFRSLGPEKRLGVNRYNEPTDRTPYLGFEIEYEVEGRHDRYDVAKRALDLFGSRRVYCKEDGSIHSGFELVSHPATLEWWMANFNWDGFRELRSNRSIASRDNCGFHIHVSKAGFSSPAHEFRWMLFYFRNQSYVTALAGRTSSYAEFSMTNRAVLANIAKGKVGSPERYSVINSQNEHTHEVRIFASTPFVNRIKAALQFVESTVEYTRSLAASKVLADGGFSWDEYVSWLVSKGPRYRQLIKRIADTCTGLYVPPTGATRVSDVRVDRQGRAVPYYSDAFYSSVRRSFVTQEGKKA